MPRLSEAMKDVISCDKLRVGANDHWFEDFRMGQPDMVKPYHLTFSKRLTRRTETSKYAEENKTKVIPLVAASELGTAQTYIVLAI